MTSKEERRAMLAKAGMACPAPPKDEPEPVPVDRAGQPLEADEADEQEKEGGDS